VTPVSPPTLVDVSHAIESGMLTYKGLPAPVVCDYLSREASRARYEPGTEFHIGRIDMVANTGTYLDAPFHRYADGVDVAGLALEQLALLDGVVVRAPHERGLAVDREHFAGLGASVLRGKAVLVHTGWDVHWRTERYFGAHPFLTAEAAAFLADAGVTLAGIDSHNIDDTRTRARPVHSTLLGRGVLVVEHLTNLAALPDRGFRFSAVPVRVVGMGTFPVRAFAAVG
jgi:kynurenine formamidase